MCDITDTQWFGELIANCRRYPEYFDIQLFSTLSAVSLPSNSYFTPTTTAASARTDMRPYDDM
jgi:hypothetical protein